MFVDIVKIYIKAGNGGNGPGCASRETCRVCAGKLPGIRSGLPVRA